MSKKVLNVTMYDSKGKVEKFEIPITKEIKKELNRAKKLSCQCEEPDEYPRFVRNYKGVSHGYICRKCGKFVQFG